MLWLFMARLDAEVKKKLLDKVYTDEEVRGIYDGVLADQSLQKKKLLVLGILLALLTLSLLVLPIVVPNIKIEMSLLLVLVPIFLVLEAVGLTLGYYVGFGRFKQQFMRAASVHYAHILQEKEA